jgi:hypothetical protein
VLVITWGSASNGPPEVVLINPATDRVIGGPSPGAAPQGAAQTVAVTPNGQFACAASYRGTGGVWVLDLATRKNSESDPGTRQGLAGIAVSPNGRFAIAADLPRAKYLSSLRRP